MLNSRFIKLSDDNIYRRDKFLYAEVTHPGAEVYIHFADMSSGVLVYQGSTESSADDYAEEFVNENF